MKDLMQIVTSLDVDEDVRDIREDLLRPLGGLVVALPEHPVERADAGDGVRRRGIGQPLEMAGAGERLAREPDYDQVLGE